MHGGPKGHNGGGENIYVAYFETVDYALRTVGGAKLGTSTGRWIVLTRYVGGAPGRPHRQVAPVRDQGLNIRAG
ncbi:MAG TPA: hypothetical protein VNO31_04600 [Umezawaea sp.]|nr:hypothetical protein [Umezawaea sp.]